VQRRVPSAIAEVLSNISYNGTFRTADAEIDQSCSWLDVMGTELRHETSKYSKDEVDQIEACLKYLTASEEKPIETVVSTFYSSQASKLREALEKFPHVQMATVDSYQEKV
jgi:superfamily I DNA and/or RNA helicase